MLRIIHTGRAYEVLDLTSPVRCLAEDISWLHELRDKYAALKTRYWQQGVELEKTCREVGHLKALLFALEQKFKAAELGSKPCKRKSTFEVYGSQDPH